MSASATNYAGQVQVGCLLEAAWPRIRMIPLLDVMALFPCKALGSKSCEKNDIESTHV